MIFFKKTSTFFMIVATKNTEDILVRIVDRTYEDEYINFNCSIMKIFHFQVTEEPVFNQVKLL